MATSYDLDPEPLISRLAGPLSPADRQAFREAALMRWLASRAGVRAPSIALLRPCSVTFSTHLPITRRAMTWVRACENRASFPLVRRSVLLIRARAVVIATAFRRGER